MYTLLERLYSMQTTMKRTNFSRWFDKLDLNFQKVYTHSRSSSHICITITHIRTACSFIFQHSKKPAKYKNDSQTAKSHLVSPNFSRNLFLSTFQRRNCKKIRRQLPLLPQWVRTHPLSKPIFLNQRSAVNDVNFHQQTVD